MEVGERVGEVEWREEEESEAAMLETEIGREGVDEFGKAAGVEANERCHDGFSRGGRGGRGGVRTRKLGQT